MTRPRSGRRPAQAARLFKSPTARARRAGWRRAAIGWLFGSALLPLGQRLRAGNDVSDVRIFTRGGRGAVELLALPLLTLDGFVFRLILTGLFLESLVGRNGHRGLSCRS